MAAESDFGIFQYMKKACTEGGWVKYGNFGSPIFGRDQSGNHDTDPYGVEKPVILGQKCVKNGILGTFGSEGPIVAYRSILGVPPYPYTAPGSSRKP